MLHQENLNFKERKLIVILNFLIILIQLKLS